ncbi:MAG TPA: glycosyltransferase family 9 protein [Verrucomicrobiae bacterium]|nr:glycosyltransferase family 9 protein [Verrucomicrobiae bacterium]
MPADGRILLIRLGGLGDVVFTLPAVQALRAAFPQAQMDFLVDKKFASLLEGFPGIQNVLTLDRAGCKRLNPRALLLETVSLLWRLRRRRFGLVVDFQGFGETGWISWWTRAPERWGSVYRPARAWAYTRPVRRNPALHPVEYDLDVIQAGGVQPAQQAAHFALPQRAAGQARDWLRQHSLDAERPTLLLHPFTSSSHKNWGVDSYLALARLARQQGVQVVFSGGPAERAALAPASEAGFAVAAGAPLLVSVGLANLATLLAGGDTGLLHVAVAMGKRVLMLMGSLEPGACHPYGHRDWALVPAAGLPVTSIPVQRVWENCSRVFGQKKDE